MTSKASLEETFWPTGTALPGLAKRALLVTNIASPEVQSKARSKVLKETRPVIIDIGTGSCKIGYAGDPKPSFVVSSTVVKPFRETCKTGGIQKEYLIGKEKEFFPNISQKLVNPLWHGAIVDWDCIEAMLEYLFVQEMKITPDEHAVLLSDPPLSPITNREKYIEMMFETFNVPAFHMAYQPRLAMYSYGRTSSLVVECGHGVSYAVPISEGHVLTSLTSRVDYAGADITKCLMENLNGTGHKFNVEHRDIIEDVKNKFCYISFDFNNELRLPQKKYLTEYKLPDGQRIIIGKERFICPEVLFRPSLMGSPQPGVQDLTMTSINNCDASLKNTMLNNILLCGGITMLEGFPERFQKELNQFSCHQKPCVLAWPERQFSTWRGGSVLASLKSFQQVWLYRKEYEEHGPSIVYRRCF
ncbi:actin-like protein 7A [Bufo bufo]|uniref:actin-like protein 7A n=1 Tax=Bufo bufo TaxID=8384 RepID=UPI001ABE8D0A|nr:actin-like protein 7A [Bufo bufo]